MTNVLNLELDFKKLMLIEYAYHCVSEIYCHSNKSQLKFKFVFESHQDIFSASTLRLYNDIPKFYYGNIENEGEIKSITYHLSFDNENIFKDVRVWVMDCLLHADLDSFIKNPLLFLKGIIQEINKTEIKIDSNIPFLFNNYVSLKYPNLHLSECVATQKTYKIVSIYSEDDN